MDSLNIIPKATTIREQYWRFLITGGDASLLPKPTNKRDEFLYALCLFRGNEVGTQSNKAYVKAVLNSDSNGQNYFSTFYDLGEEKSITEAKVIFRFTLRNTGNDKPASIGAKLFANNIEDRNNITEYALDAAALVNTPEYDKEYNVVANYTATLDDKKLSNYRYLKPFIVLNKAVQGKDKAHGLDIHEVTLIIGNEKIDLTKTVQDFVPVQGGKSKIEVIESKTETEKENTIVKEYVKALLNSDSVGQNYFSVMHDLGETERITEAKFECRFTLRNTGNDKPESIGVKLFANNDPNRDVITDYTLDVPSLVTAPEYDKEYKIEANYTATSGDKNLNTFRYIKPFVVLNKANKAKTSTNGIDIHEAKITINGKAYGLTKTVKDFAPVEGGASKVEVIKETNVTSVKPYAGKKAGFLGDSITAGLDPDNPSKMLANPWVSQLKELCGFSEVINYGIPSTTISTNNTVSNWNQLRQPMCERYKQMADDLDVIGLKASINDFWLNQPVGTYGSEDTSTIYGAFNVTLKGLKEKYPNGKIFVMLPLDYRDKNYGLNTNGVGTKLDEYRKAITDMCKLNNVHLFDLQAAVHFTAANDEDMKNFIPDGLHPNQAGHNDMAPEIAEEINTNL